MGVKKSSKKKKWVRLAVLKDREDVLYMEVQGDE
jgi:hypothetical protein